jgi:hypothetical protein
VEEGGSCVGGGEMRGGLGGRAARAEGSGERPRERRGGEGRGRGGRAAGGSVGLWRAWRHAGRGRAMEELQRWWWWRRGGGRAANHHQKFKIKTIGKWVLWQRKWAGVPGSNLMPPV